MATLEKQRDTQLRDMVAQQCGALDSFFHDCRDAETQIAAMKQFEEQIRHMEARFKAVDLRAAAHATHFDQQCKACDSRSKNIEGQTATIAMQCEEQICSVVAQRRAQIATQGFRSADRCYTKALRRAWRRRQRHSAARMTSGSRRSGCTRPRLRRNARRGRTWRNA